MALLIGLKALRLRRPLAVGFGASPLLIFTPENRMAADFASGNGARLQPSRSHLKESLPLSFGLGSLGPP
jgi:hypothetical protein